MTPAQDPGRPGAVRTLALLALLAVAALIASRWSDARSWTSLLRSRSVDSTAFGSGDTAQVLQRLGLLHQMPPQLQKRGQAPIGKAADDRVLSLDGVPPEHVSSALGIDPSWLERDVPILSVILEPGKLAKLLEDPHARGRGSEKRGFVAYVDEGKLQFASGAGVRLHGGDTRLYPILRSFRLYFRQDYGLARFTPAIFPGRVEQPPEVFVVGNNIDGWDGDGKRWYFVEPLAYDIARRVGLPAPETQPAVFFLNGDFRGAFVLTEYLGLDYLRAHYGHDRFVLVRTKKNRDSPDLRVRHGDPARYAELLDWLADPAPMTRDAAARRVELDNLSRWFVTVLFCATGDVFNGPMLLDETRPDARWFWVAWDLQFSFGLPYFPEQAGAERDIWRYAILRRNRTDPRAVLLRRLLRESPDYRAEFLRLFTDTLNHRLSEGFLAERLDHYRGWAEKMIVGDTRYLEQIDDFLVRRKGVLRRQLAEHLQAGESFQVRVEAPQKTALVIDGYEAAATFSGRYFDGQTIDIRAADGMELRTAVNGRAVQGSGPSFRLEVRENVAIRIEPSPPN